MKTYVLLSLLLIPLFSSGCSVQSAVRKGIETVYKTSVDERSIGHILQDKKLTSLIMTELIKDDVTNILDVTAECFFGYPFVVGECNTLDEAQRIMDIAEKITGKQAIPYLLKKGGGDDCNPALNLKIATEVKARLVADKKIFATNVVVKSVQCQAVLLGVLGSKEYILAAIEHSENVGGVKKVQSLLVSTDTGRSWDSVFKAMGAMAGKSDDNTIPGLNNNKDKNIEPLEAVDQKSNDTGDQAAPPEPDDSKQTIEPSPSPESMQDDNSPEALQPAE